MLQTIHTYSFLYVLIHNNGIPSSNLQYLPIRKGFTEMNLDLQATCRPEPSAGIQKTAEVCKQNCLKTRTLDPISSPVCPTTSLIPLAFLESWALTIGRQV